MQSSAGGRVVVVTGANEGIGYHLLAALVEDGYRVAGLDVAGKTESTRPVIYADWVTRVGFLLAQWFPFLVERGIERFLTDREATAGGDR